MRPLEIGFALTTLEDIPAGKANSWETIASMARRTEELGFDSLWFADELLWKVERWPGPRGFWEAASLAGALAGSTSNITIGSWVFSAIHRHPALTVRIAETLDEISGGRFVLGFGAGHGGNAGFAYPTDRIVARFEEALQIVLPMLREGEADFAGRYHKVVELPNRPRGPRPGRIPIMLAGDGPRLIALAAEHGDRWSCIAARDSRPQAFAERMRLMQAACAEIGRDPATLGKSASVWVDAGTSDAMGVMLPADPEPLAEAANEFAELGFDSLELAVFPENPETLEMVAGVLALLDN